MGQGEQPQLGEQERADSVQAFKALGVCEQLAEAAASLGWKAPTQIQQQAIPALLAGAAESYGQPNVSPLA